MQIYVPERVRTTLIGSATLVRSDFGTFKVGIPVSGYYLDVNPTIFRGEKGHDINNVVHQKVVGKQGSVATAPVTVDSVPFVFQGSQNWTKSGGWYCYSEWHITTDFVPGRGDVKFLVYDTAGINTSNGHCTISFCRYYAWTSPSGTRYYGTNYILTPVRNPDGHWVISGYPSSLGFTWEIPWYESLVKDIQSRPKWEASVELAKYAFGAISWPPIYASSTASSYNASNLKNGWLLQLPDNKSRFLFNEVAINDGLDPLALAGETKFYWRNWLIQHAYFDALESAPKLNDNTLQNISEVASFIKGLVLDHKVEVPKSLQDAWLSYRYVYSTAKADVKDAIKFVHRYRDLGGLDSILHCYGESSTYIGDIFVQCRCCLDLEPRNVNMLRNIWNKLDILGLTPDFYVIWDSIPYSFIVDWFIPVGDMVSVFDANAKFSAENYIISNVCFSFKYVVKDGYYDYSCYHRFRSAPLPSLNEFYWLDRPDSSTKTVMKRIADAASLIIK